MCAFQDPYFPVKVLLLHRDQILPDFFLKLFQFTPLTFDSWSRVAQDDRPFTPDPSGGETALRMTPRVVVLNKVKDLALCHPEERSEEGSRVWFNQNQKQILPPRIMLP